ncbi:nucleotidyltransferase family protein [Chromobacterium sp. IIBBL 290-4]|uniref:nucleotidyltransferase family protein n=1 Tax=Chromobacterium sp. IIBBL 290-4 TaxID=2953890 RepID=UPI0020B72B91|nr:nucleotidyltransferase family protein [Chromobacterium sp. IIBBL 290-4]UTH75445.1 nucleotidyltransferase family protein [Chromobacterium sp. IIBBL 290-4]
MASEARQAERLIELVRASPWLMRALRAARGLELASWCIGAGAVRNLVWDALHGLASQPSALSDIDLAYYDADDLSPEREAALQARLQASHPDLPWEVTNQAAVHLWFAEYFGHAVEPLPSLEAALASWPEYATAVGVELDEQDNLQVIAPYGLEDLFGMVVRRNPARVSLETYRQRVAQKRYAERWPRVRVVHE